MAKGVELPWDRINTVLLDMDGTLLDQHHEDAFWDEMVPRAYAKKNKMRLDDAKYKLSRMYATKYGTLDWGNVEFWEKELGMSLWDIRYKAKNLMKIHPHTMRFLNFLKKKGKKLYLVTAANKKDLDYKMTNVKLGKYFDGMFNEIELEVSKQTPLFWERLQRLINYGNESTMLIDDNETILNAAKSHGIKWLVLKTKPSSRKPESKPKTDVLSVRYLDDIIPASKR